MAWRLFGGVLAVLVVEIHELVAMHAVERQDDHHDEVRDEQRGVEPVPAVEVLEGVVAVVRSGDSGEDRASAGRKRGRRVKAERAFENKRFQQGRASSGDLKSIVRWLAAKLTAQLARIFPEGRQGPVLG